MANSSDADHSAASDLGLKCLQRPICPSTSGPSCSKLNMLLVNIFRPAQWLGGRDLFCDRDVAGLIPSRVIPKTLKMVLFRLALSIKKMELELVSSVSL